MEPLEKAAYEVAEDDVIALYARVMGRSRLIEATYRRNWRNGVAAGLLLAAPLTAALYLSAPDPRSGAIRAGAGLVFSALIWCRFAAQQLTRKAFERKRQTAAEQMVRQRQVPVTLGTNEVLLYPDSLVVSEPTMQAAKPWTVVTGIERESDALFITCSDETIVRIPRRAFAADGHEERFVRTVEELAAGEPARAPA